MAIRDDIHDYLIAPDPAAPRLTRRVTGTDQTGAEADISVVSPEAAGWPMTFVVEVALERERIDLLDAFRKTMLRHDEVQQCYYVTGDVDFILIVHAQDMRAYEAFSRRIFSENPNIRRYATHVVVDRVKVGLRVPLGRE